MTFEEFEKLVAFGIDTQPHDAARGLVGFTAVVEIKAYGTIDRTVFFSYENETWDQMRESCAKRLYDNLQREFGHTDRALLMAWQLGHTRMSFDDAMERIREKERFEWA